MLRWRGKNLFSRGVGFSVVVALGAEFLEFQLQVDKIIILWTILVALFILGGLSCLVPLDFPEYDRANRWYNAAYRAGWVVCELFGALLIGAAVIWAITGPRLDTFPLASEVLILTAQVWLMVGGLVIGGLAAAGWLAKGNEETREWARSWGRTHGAAGTRSAEENIPPE